MERWRRWFAPDKLLRWHFLASPFGIALTTWLVTRWQTGTAHFDELANFVSISAVIYGGVAVTVEMLIIGGSKAVFYGIATIIKLLDERKDNKRAEAVRLVSNDNTLFEQVLEQRRAKERDPDAENNGR